PDDKALRASLAQAICERQGGDDTRVRGRSHDERAVPADGARDRDVPAEQSAQTRRQLIASGLHGGCRGRNDQLCDGGTVFGEAGGVRDQAITQPQVVAVLGAARLWRDGDEPDRPGEQEREPRGRAHADAPQAGTRGTRASAGSAQRVLGISGAQPGRSGSWSYGYAPSRRKSS